MTQAELEKVKEIKDFAVECAKRLEGILESEYSNYASANAVEAKTIAIEEIFRSLQ